MRMSPLAIVELYLEVGCRYGYYSFSQYFQPLSEEDTCKDTLLCDYTFNEFFHLFLVKTLLCKSCKPRGIQVHHFNLHDLNQTCLEVDQQPYEYS